MWTGVSGSLQDSRANMTMKQGCCCEEAHYIECRNCGDVDVVNICCLKLKRDDWAHPIILRALDWEIGDSCVLWQGANNLCGKFEYRVCGGLYSLKWRTLGEGSCGSVTMTISLPRFYTPCNVGDASDIAAYTFTFSTTSDWHKSPLTVTDAGRDYTITVCAADQKDVIDVASKDFFLLRSVTDVSTSLSAINYPTFDGGTALCSNNAVCPFQTHGAATLSWKYYPLDDTVYLCLNYGIAVSPFFDQYEFTAPFDSGNWHNNLFPLVIALLDFNVTYYKIDSCEGIPPPPPPPPPPDCEVTNSCYPCPCVTEGTEGAPVVIIFADVATPLWTATVGLTWNASGGVYQYLSGGFPEQTVTLQCLGGDPVLYTLVVNDGVDGYILSFTGVITCDGTEMGDRTASDGIASVHLWTNNGGGG